MVEGERFELSVDFLDPRPFSKRLVSATHPSLRATANLGAVDERYLPLGSGPACVIFATNAAIVSAALGRIK